MGAFGWGGAYGTESWADPQSDVAASVGTTSWITCFASATLLPITFNTSSIDTSCASCFQQSTEAPQPAPQAQAQPQSTEAEDRLAIDLAVVRLSPRDGHLIERGQPCLHGAEGLLQ